MFGLIGSVKTFSKVLGVGMNVGPFMAYILYIYFFLSFIQKRGFGGPKKCSLQVSGIFFMAILTIKLAEFLKL